MIFMGKAEGDICTFLPCLHYTNCYGLLFKKGFSTTHCTISGNDAPPDYLVQFYPLSSTNGVWEFLPLTRLIVETQNDDYNYLVGNRVVLFY